MKKLLIVVFVLVMVMGLTGLGLAKPIQPPPAGDFVVETPAGEIVVGDEAGNADNGLAIADEASDGVITTN